MAVYQLGVDHLEVLLMRIGAGGVGASVVGMGESLRDTVLNCVIHRLHWHS